ncbi:MAG: DNA gyrase/topoisomerase IV subunit A [Chitinophagales bacterium]
MEENENIEEHEEATNPEEASEDGKITLIDGLYENWFLDYASYVILERAVPFLNDGLKPVQRRILHALKIIDDGRFHKVANVIGQTMQYHPHGDMAIGDALVKIGQKELLFDTQGNWGDIRTGDSAAASRYIEVRLSKFALDVAFNPQTTEWQLSYDGRKKEPVTLPMKFPMVLASGVEGIAVGLATKILPHNFNELLKACIDHLKGKSFKLLPDFPTGGLADCSEYKQGKRGSKVLLRARIEQFDKETLLIKEIPYGTTTTQLIDSILKANDKGTIKIKKVVDNTAKDVEIQIDLPKGVSPSVTIDALYAFTSCQSSISPNACVIIDDKPVFMGINDMLRTSVEQTVGLLKRELEIKLHELEEKWHFSSLEKIFIENRIYRDIEECETWEAVIEAIDKGLDPFKSQLIREVTEEDIVRLTEIKIKRISKFDAFKADELILKLEEEIAQVKHDLAHLTDYAIAYYTRIMEKYGKGRERKTEIIGFDTVEVKEVVANNAKLYVDRKEGFVGIGKDMKKAEFVCECSDIDDVIVFREDGKYSVTKVDDKTFTGKDIIYVGIWKKGDDRMTYNAIYRDGKTGKSFAKRFNVKSATRDREYDLTTGDPKSKTLYFSANPNGEAEVVSVKLTQSSSARKKIFDFYFSELEIKGRSSKGNTLTKYPVRKVTLSEEGISTLGGLDVWLDEAVGKINTDGHGRKLGSFLPEDQILMIFNSGEYMLTPLEMSYRFPMHQLSIIEKYDPKKVITAVHYMDSKKCNYVKRFQIETSTADTKFLFIGEESKDKLVFATTNNHPTVAYTLYGAKKDDEPTEIDLTEVIDVKGWKSTGNKLTEGTIRTMQLIASDEEEESSDNDDDNTDPEDDNNPSAEDVNTDDNNEEEEKEATQVTKVEKVEKETKVEKVKEVTEVPKVDTESKKEDKPKEKPKPNTDNIEFEITNLKSGEQGSLF